MVLEAVVEGWAGGSGGASAGPPAAVGALVARLDATQEAIERGNAALVNEAGPLLVDIVARDGLDGGAPQLQQAVALHLLSALVAAASAAPGGGAAVGGVLASPAPAAMGQSSGALVAALFAQNVPQALLQGLSGVPQVRCGVIPALQASHQHNVVCFVTGLPARCQHHNSIPTPDLIVACSRYATASLSL